MKDQSVAALVEGNQHLQTRCRRQQGIIKAQRDVIYELERAIWRKRIWAKVLLVIGCVNTVAFWFVFAVLLAVM